MLVGSMTSHTLQQTASSSLTPDPDNAVKPHLGCWSARKLFAVTSTRMEQTPRRSIRRASPATPPRARRPDPKPTASAKRRRAVEFFKGTEVLYRDVSTAKELGMRDAPSTPDTDTRALSKREFERRFKTWQKEVRDCSAIVRNNNVVAADAKAEPPA